MSRVVCLHAGTKYGPEYVDRLERGLTRNTTRPFRFEVLRLLETLVAPFPLWWLKLWVFPPAERTIFLDLDTVIVGNVDFLFDYEGPFCILRDFYRPLGYGSAVMSIAPGFGADIRDRFVADAENIMARLHGDQSWIEEQISGADLWQDLYPGRIGSLKADNLDNGPNGFSIVCMHGFPKPHELPKDHWARKAWENHADPSRQI